jgi:hypothetical protein
MGPVQNVGMDEEGAIAWGVGEVCIAASSLEWSLAYLTSVLWRKGDAWFVNLCSRPGRTLPAFSKFVESLAVLAPELQLQAEGIRADASALLMQRHRVVHSVMVGELEPGSHVFEAWHAKSGETWSVDAADLSRLTAELKRCAELVDDFGTKWEHRADHEGWSEPDIASPLNTDR